MTAQRQKAAVIFFSAAALMTAPSGTSAEDPAYHHAGPLAGSLVSADPLPVFDPDPTHLWNRIFAALYTRERSLPSKDGGPPLRRIEGGDVIDFLGWKQTTYWSSPEISERMNALFDEFLAAGEQGMVAAPLHRAIFLRDLWAVFDFLIDQNIDRQGGPDDRRRREALCEKLARIIESLALAPEKIADLPDTYAAALDSDDFAPSDPGVPSPNDLPRELLTDSDEWGEIDFYQPDRPPPIPDRFVTKHTRAYRGRSYFRIFYRYPGGRDQLEEHLESLRQSGVDWKQTAQTGLIRLLPEAAQLPVGARFVLVQFMMTLDDKLRPVPTRIVESIRLRTYRNIDGTAKPPTNTGQGMDIGEYTLSRRLLFDDLRNGGLHLEPDDLPQYRVIFQDAPLTPDWGAKGRVVLSQQCADCHLGRHGVQNGVRSIYSITNLCGFSEGAQKGISLTLTADEQDVRGIRAAGWKSHHETYRRLLEYLGR